MADLIRRVRRNPNTRLADGETLDPEQIAFLITRPKRSPPPDGETADGPQWLRFLRSLFSGLYTVDNMDFVLRDAYMSGYSARAFDLDRLLHYSLFTAHGLTIHERGLSALVRFISVRAELFRAIYFHRTVRAIDLDLARTVSRQQATSVSRQSAGASRRVPAAHRMVAADAGFGLADSDRPELRALGPALARVSAPQVAVEDGLRADGVFRARRGRTGQRVEQRGGVRGGRAARVCRRS